jgi:hypothetical protein
VTFVEQRITSGGPGEGDCMRACVASILGRAYEDVPDLSEKACTARGTGQHWATVHYLRELGLTYQEVNGAWATHFEHGGWLVPWAEQELIGRLDLSGLSLGYAWSPRVRDSAGRRSGHCVVLYDGGLIWDPHPRREMGIGPVYGYLIPTTLRGERLHI